MSRIGQLLITSLLALASCTSQRHDDAATSSSKPNEARDAFIEARDRIVREAEAKLEQLDVKLANLRRDAESHAATLTSDGKPAFAAAIAKLEKQRAAAHRALEEARRSTTDLWQQVKQRTDEALKDVDEAYEAAAKQLRD